jgi:hypothetical protein
MVILQSGAYRFGHGLNLTVRTAGGDEQVIGEGGESLDFENPNLQGFLFQRVGCAQYGTIF